MSTVFDVLTVTAFLAVALAYFMWGRHDLGLLMRLLISAVAFAVANQLGNAGWVAAAFLLLLAGTGYAAFCFRRS